MPENRIYLDHLTTTPLHPAVRTAMEPWLDSEFGSPASYHQGGLRARDALAQARAEVAALIGVTDPECILFTASATEAANLAIKGVAWAPHRRGNHIVLSQTAHPAVTGSVAFLEQHGFRATRLGVDPQGFIDPESVRSALTPDTCLLCVPHADHDLGARQPLEAIAEIAADHEVALFVDASASGGWVPLDVRAFPVGLLSLAPHRFHGPKGVGVLYRHRRARLASLVHGGNQEAGLRAGTENLPAVVGTGVAARLAAGEMDSRISHVTGLQSALLAGLGARIPLLKLNGPPTGPLRLPHHLNLSLEFIEGEGLTLALDLRGVAIHSGPACLAGSQRIPPALTSAGLSPALARASVLMAPGMQNTAAQITDAVERIVATVEKLREMSPLWDNYQAGTLPSDITGSKIR